MNPFFSLFEQIGRYKKKNCFNKKINRKYIDEEVVWKIFTQIVLALDECHHRKGGVVLHRDVKPDNILLDKDSNVKLSDFGLSRVLNTTDVMAQTFLGTPYYMSPVHFFFLSFFLSARCRWYVCDSLLTLLDFC